jgi:hypothetical protein
MRHRARVLLLPFLFLTAAPAAAFAQLPFSYIVTPPTGARIATPFAEIRANSPGPGQPRPGHSWFALADGTGVLTVTLADRSPDGAKATIFNAANVPVAAIAPISGSFANPARGSATFTVTPGATCRRSTRKPRAAGWRSMSSSAERDTSPAGCPRCGLHPVAAHGPGLTIAFNMLTLGMVPTARRPLCTQCGRRRDLWMLLSLVVLVPIAIAILVGTTITMAIG